MKKFLVLLLSFAIVTPASARGWIKISSWAYNDVSVFTNYGLIPDSFDSITDYTQKSTRAQFAELLFNAVNSKHSITDMFYIGYESHERIHYGDYIEYLKLLDIMKGMPDGNFYPDLPITREDAAVSIYRTITSFRFYFPDDYKYSNTSTCFTDEDEISAYATEAAKSLYSYGIIKGSSDGKFNPGAHISIEESILMLNRLYSLWQSPEMTDGYNIISGEKQFVKSYGNGFSEFKNPSENKYIITDGEKSIELPTEIYSKILCVTLPDNKTYIGAVTFNKTSDIYDTNGNILFTIPYKLHSMTEEYICTEKNSTHGIYSYSGTELFKPLYSLYELDVIKSNDYCIPVITPSIPEGTAYYIENGTGNLYSTDSNGENKVLISDKNCTSVSYYKGILYYSTSEGLIARYKNGTEITITDKNAVICSNGNVPVFTGNTFSQEENYAFPDMNNKLFYIELTGENSGNLYSFSITGNEVIYDFIDSNVFVSKDSTASPHIYKNHLYYSVVDENGNNILMRTGSNYNKEKISGNIDILLYGFYNDELVISSKKNIFYKTGIDKIELTEFEPAGGDAQKEKSEKYSIIKRISALYHISDTGAEQLISEFPHTYQLSGNYLYYTENTDEIYLQNLYLYNLNSGERKLLATSGINGFIYSEEADCVIYEALNSQLWRIDGELISQIYPNGGLFKYENAELFRRIGTDLVKISKDGNCLRIAENVSYYGWIYVENGSETVSASKNF